MGNLARDAAPASSPCGAEGSALGVAKAASSAIPDRQVRASLAWPCHYDSTGSAGGRLAHMGRCLV